MYSERKKDILYKVYATVFIASEWEKKLEFAYDCVIHANEKMIQHIDGFHAYCSCIGIIGFYEYIL